MSVLKVKDNGEWKDIPSIKGEQGDAAGFGVATASVDTGTGTPSCVVTLTGDDTAKNFDFAFHNLMYDDSDLQSDFADLESDFTTLQGQFDTAVAALTVDSEVADIRVGDDGVTYASAGAAVRGQFHDVKSALNSTNNENRPSINFKWEHGGIDNATGGLNNEGSLTRSRDQTYYKVSDLYSVTNGTSSSTLWLIFYTESGGTYTFANSTSVSAGNTYTFSSGDYVRFDLRGSLTDATLVNGLKDWTQIVKDIKNVRDLAYNYLLFNDLLLGYYIDQNGNNVLDYPNNNFYYTDYIEVAEGFINYKGIGLSSVSVVSFYNSSKTFISSIVGNGLNEYAEGITSIPANATYMRFCTLKKQEYSDLDVSDIKLEQIAYIPITERKAPEFEGVTWLAVGDSITYGDTVDGYAYPNYIADSTSIILSKEGHSGYSMGALYNMRSQFIATCDIATVFAGTNDFNNNIPLGAISDNTTSTFYGTINLMMQYMQSTYNNAPVIFFTPIWRNYNGSASGVIVGMVNNNGDNLKDFAEAIIACGKRHGVPVVDLCNESGIGEYNITGLTSDGVHPNARGQKVLAGIFKFVLYKYADYLD